MEAVDLIGLLIPVTYLLMLAVEARWPARDFPPRRGWRWLGVVFLLVVATVGTVVPLLLPVEWMAAHRWIDGTVLGIAGGTVVGWLVQSAVAALWHRASHAFSPVWRFGHQVHHGPQRIDISGSVLFHPTEMVVQTLIQLFVTVIVLGLHPVAAALVGYLVAFHGFFQHWNVHTPRWLGYAIQRPESHCLHHGQGVHAYNYSDFPLWDMLCGSFRNPARHDGACGFESPADRRLVAMLAFRDVNAPLYGQASRGTSTEAAAA